LFVPRLVPVDNDPFSAPSGAPRLEPVDFDPFAGKDVTQNPTEQQQVAPASGPFPAVKAGETVVPEGTVLPQSDQGVRPPPPNIPPASDSDPGILAEAYGDTVKGFHSTKRGAFLTGYMTGMYDDVDNIARHLAASESIEAQYPSSPVNRKAQEELERIKDSGAGGILPSLGVYARNPRFAASTAIQSLPSMLGSLVTVPVGAVGGALVAGPPGAAAGGLVGLGVGSAAADFGNAFEEYARDKWKPRNEAEWKAILLDPVKYEEAGNYAALHAGMVGVFDAIGGKLGGKVGAKIVGERIASPVGRVAATGVTGAPVGAAVGAGGEAAGQLAGGGTIRDPGAVAGEFAAGIVTDIPASSIEAATKALNIGGTKATPVTPEGVAAATAALNVTPEMVSGSLSAMDTSVFYSPARKYVEEKGPGAASPEQWLGTLRNAPGVKQEELADLGLDKFLAEAGPKVTKRDVLEYLDENAIQIEETHREQVNTDDLDDRQRVLLREMNERAARNPALRDSTGAMITVGNELEPLMQEYQTTVERRRNKPQYESYTLPGERRGYTELTLHLPTRNVDVDTTGWTVHDLGMDDLTNEWRGVEVRDATGRHRGYSRDEVSDDADIIYNVAKKDSNVQKDFVGGHYPEPNVVVHARVTDRVARDGTPMALIEEIQSDWHQLGRKQGYQDVATLSNPRLIIENADGQHKWEFDTSDGRVQYGWGPTVAEAQINAQGFETFRASSRGAVPGPFRQSWDELAFKRMLRWAADKGYRRIAWVNADEQIRRYGPSTKRDRGMDQFYNKIIPSIAKRWAKRLGGVMGETTIQSDSGWTVKQTGPNTFVPVDANGNRPTGVHMWPTLEAAQAEIDNNNTRVNIVQHIDLPLAAVELIQRGLPIYSEVESAGGRKPTGATLDELAGPAKPDLTRFAGDMVLALNELVKRLKLPVDVHVTFHEGKQIVRRTPDGRTSRVTALGMATGTYARPEIHIALGAHSTAAEVWATMTHELGHHVMVFKFATAPADVKIAIRAAYDAYRASVPHNQNMQEFIQRRDNAVIALFQTRGKWTNSAGYTTQFNDLNPQQRQYWAGFEEWFAEQVARWATSDARPVTMVDKFFKNLAVALRLILKAAREKFGLPFEASKAVSDWLNSFHADVPPFAEDAVIQARVETTADNQRHMGPEEKAEERQPETVVARETIDKIFNGRPPKEVQEAAAYADKFNKIYKYALGIHHVAQRNPHIAPLQAYVETLAVAGLTKQQVMARALEVEKAWNKLGERQADAVAALIDDVTNYVYLSPDEVKNKVARFPTQAEIGHLATKHKVSAEGLAVFAEVAKTFQEHLTRVDAVLRSEARKIVDPVAQAKRMKEIDAYIANLRAKPYFPAMRFGDFTITVRNDAGQVIHFETFEKERTRNAAAEAIHKQGVAKDKMELGKLDRAVKPLMGVPRQLLEMMADKLNLGPAQRDALDQLKYELSPAQSFKHRFQHKNRIAGYSSDFRRVYANYFMHGANHLMRAMHADTLREYARLTKEETKGVYDVTTRHEIVEFMNDHLQAWLDPKSDWAQIRALAFLWQLAWSPAAATQNLTQTLLTSYPFLAQQFGDVKAMGALLRAITQISTFHKRGKYEGATEFELRAIGRGIKDGIVTEAMAPELAGYAQGETLGLGFGAAVQRKLNRFNELGGKMFELAEQMNRRLVFRAALKLAQDNPGAKYLKDMRAKHRLHFDGLVKEGWTEAEANAYVAARDAVIATQFQYAKEYLPRTMRGGAARTVLVFKTFILNYCIFLSSYPAAAVRSMLILGFLGGLSAFPGMEDLRGILKAIGWRLFGREFDLEKEARKLILDMTGNDNVGDKADLILHGVSKYGYGIPQAMDMLGGTVGVDIRMPTFDRSRAISAGTLLPVDFGALFGPPTRAQDAIIAEQAQKASGALFGTAFNMYKALTAQTSSMDDFKRWEKAMPRGVASVSKAFRMGSEGRDRNSKGATIVKYDVRDSQQLMELIGMSMGYTPAVQTQYWDRTMAGVEAVRLWDIQRTGLMKQMGNAVLGKDQKEITRVKDAIQRFNSTLPREAAGKAITGDVLRQSIGTQAQSRAAQEAEVSVKKSDIPILHEVQRLYPDAKATSVRRVPRAQQPQ